MFTDVFNNALLKTIKACYTHFSTKEPCDIVYAEKLQLLFFFFCLQISALDFLSLLPNVCYKVSETQMKN